MTTSISISARGQQLRDDKSVKIQLKCDMREQAALVVERITGLVIRYSDDPIGERADGVDASSKTELRFGQGDFACGKARKRKSGF